MSLVIWANHMLRAAITAMQATAAGIHASRSLVDSEGRIASVAEVFRLQGADELAEAEKRYAADSARNAGAIVRAATRGQGLDALTAERPKVMIPVAGKPVLRRLVDKFKGQGVNRITVVAGYRADAVEGQGAEVVVNPDWESGSELTSLSCALDALGDDTVITYGDLLFRSYILGNLLDWQGDLLAVVDSSPLKGAEGNTNDLAWCSAPDDRAMYQQKVVLERVSRDAESASRPPDGRWVGLLRVRGEGRAALLSALDTLRQRDDFATLGMPDLLNQLVADGHAPQVQYISGHWMDLNDMSDLQRAEDFSHGRD